MHYLWLTCGPWTSRGHRRFLWKFFSRCAAQRREGLGPAVVQQTLFRHLHADAILHMLQSANPVVVDPPLHMTTLSGILELPIGAEGRNQTTR
jgi:hypothetical protein